MQPSLDQMRVDLPPEFTAEETMTSWRVPSKPAVGLPMQIEIRPNLVLHRRTIDPPADLTTLAAGIAEQLVRSVAGLSEVRSEPMVFADQAQGVLLEYSFEAMRGLRIAQLQAIRLDAQTLTTVTLSTEVSRLTAELRIRYLESLISTRPA